MTLLFPNPCYKEVCFKGTALYLRTEREMCSKCLDINRTALISVTDLQIVIVACQKGLYTQIRLLLKKQSKRSSLIRVFPVCYSDKHFLNSHPDNQNNLRTERERCSKIFGHLQYCFNFCYRFTILL